MQEPIQASVLRARPGRLRDFGTRADTQLGEDVREVTLHRAGDVGP
jgi:hypothetical protein